MKPSMTRKVSGSGGLFYVKRYSLRNLKWLADRRAYHTSNIKWELEKKRRLQEAEAEKRRMKDEADQQQADKFAKAVRTEVERLVMDIVASGVLHGRK
jgi:hypothetical protein